jgi:hypothetical protein
LAQSRSSTRRCGQFRNPSVGPMPFTDSKGFPNAMRHRHTPVYGAWMGKAFGQKLLLRLGNPAGAEVL